MLQTAADTPSTWTHSTLSTLADQIRDTLRIAESHVWGASVCTIAGLEHYARGMWSRNLRRGMESALFGSRCSGRHPQAARVFGRLRAEASVFDVPDQQISSACYVDALAQRVHDVLG